MLFGYIFINRIQPFEAANISAAFFLCRPMRKHNLCHTFKISFKTTFHALLLCIHISGIHCRKKGEIKTFDFIPKEVLLHGTDSSRKRNRNLPLNPNPFHLPIFRNLFQKTIMKKKIKTKYFTRIF